jgi:D-alanyl-D-alanine dipeptidase
MKTYRTVPIRECHDPLIAIPRELFSFTQPHPYVQWGAPYGSASPWLLRQQVIEALRQAQQVLATQRPGWRLKLFDAYRPLAVQAFMVWREFQHQAQLAGKSLTQYANPDDLAKHDPQTYDALAIKVFEFWSIPSDDPRTPPPHSTGAAVDLTLEDESGQEIDMGCPIDETTERAYPEHFAAAGTPPECDFHRHRQLLNDVMTCAGFCRHGNEWWHFSLGDQMWAWSLGRPAAIYGRAE